MPKPDHKGKEKATEEQPNEAQFASSSSSSSTELTEIEKLNNLQLVLAQNNSSLTTSIADIAINVEVEEVEKAAAVFISNQLEERGLLKTIEKGSEEVTSLLGKINFFGSEGALSLTAAAKAVGGVFSHDFSKADKEHWAKIEETLDSIYNPNTGLIKQVQDFFLFQIEKEQMLKILKREEISFEEELFIRSILIKGYLANFRQLILPFHEISDEVLIKFKKERIKSLENKTDESSQMEIKLLDNQIKKLELQIATIAEKKKEATQKERKISIDTENITAFNTKLNTGSVVAGTVETARYFTSFIGHAKDIEFLKKVGDFGLKNLGSVGSTINWLGKGIASCLPVVSAVVEIGTQANNNRIVYNYEKKLKILQVVDDTKRNLVVLEQQVMDYYLDTTISRLQEVFLEQQKKTQSLVTAWNKQQIILQSDLKLASEQIVSKINILNVSVSNLESENSVLISANSEKEERIKALTERERELLAKIDFLLVFKSNAEELEKKVEELNKVLEEKEKETGILEAKLDAKTLLEENQKSKWEADVIFRLENSVANKSQVIDNLHKELMDNSEYYKQLESDKEHLGSENSRLRQELRDTKTKLEQIKRLNDQLEITKKQKEEFEQYIRVNENESIRLNARIQELEKSLDKWEKKNYELLAVNEKIALNNSFQVSDLEKKRKGLHDELNIVLKQKEDLETELEKKETTITQLNKDKDKLEKEKNQTITKLETEKNQLTKEKELITAEKAQLQREINDNLTTLNQALREKRWHFTNHETLNNAVNDANALIRAYVPTTTNTFTATISAPFVWISNKFGSGFAWFGFYSALPTIGIIIGYAIKAYLATQTGGASLLAETAIKSPTPPQPTPPIIEASLPEPEPKKHLAKNEKKPSSPSKENETNST